MAKLVRIYNISKEAHGEPFAICAKHLKELDSRLNDHCITSVLGSTKVKCQNCSEGK